MGDNAEDNSTQRNMGLDLRAQDNARSSFVRPGKKLQGETGCPGNDSWQEEPIVLL